MKKNKKLIEKIELFLKLLDKDPLLITDYYNNNQKDYFIDNRHDQSIFSVIRKLGNPIYIIDETSPKMKRNIFPFIANRIIN